LDLKKIKINKLLIFLFLWASGLSSEAHINFFTQEPPSTESSLPQDSIKLPYEFEDEEQYPYIQRDTSSPLFLNDPDNIKSSYEYDPETDEYILKKKIGEFDYRPPAHLTREQYWDYKFDNMLKDFWRQKASGMEASEEEGLIPSLKLGGETFSRIFGSNTIDITPQGSAELIFGVNINNVEDPKLSEKLRRNTTFDFEEKIQMNVTGSIGDKIKLGINYDTEATFDFENQTKLEYSGGEDEILQDIEAGNVSMPLPGSLITGSQSLFGLKTKMRFGNLEVTSVFSQQKGESKVIQVKGGAQTQEFDIKADEYDNNRHFFLSHHFRENYNKALSRLPVIRSNIDITKVEVWITNKTSNFENSRNIIALMDLGEGRINGSTDHIFASKNLITNINRQPADNEANNLYQQITSLQGIRDISQTTNVLQQWSQYGFRSGQDFVKLENARKLNSNEYTLNEKLGYISLKSPLRNDEVLAVAFEYIKGGKKYQVGEFSNQGITAPSALMVKLLKGTAFTPKFPTWELMMKNIYSINAYQVNKEGFRLNVLYQDDKTGNEINYIPEGNVQDEMLLRLLNLDNVNSQNDANPDGMFDFIPGITINQSEGKIIFPVVQPFGDYLKKQFDNESIANKYVFEELYDSTLTIARQTAEKNKFKIKGEFQSSSSSEIPLNAMNIPEGSVVVTAGGRKLVENVDYTVDYNLGRVKILNQGLLESGTPIQISLESQSTYSMQKKTLVGSHFNYNVSEDFNVGATVMNLTERPLTRKVSIGNEPISNTIWGLNGSFRRESPFLTKMVDRIPLIDTDEKSSIRIDGEFAHLIPGHSKAIQKKGTSYIDDFEGSETSIDMKNPAAWVLASTPQGQPGIFPEGSLIDSLPYNYNRAKLAWYHIDPLFLRENSPNMPQHLKSNPEQRSSHFVREIYERELFPKRDNPNDIPASIQVLNLAFFPDERGPYNYEHEPNGTGGISEGLNTDGTLKEPESRWGGIMREISTTDFEESNVEYIEFWLMDPFVYDSAQTNDGSLYFNLGNISEDILKDSRKSFENGLPTSEQVDMVDSTSWGRIPLSQSLVNAFDNDPEAREYQDVGLDGLDDEDERTFFDTKYLEQLGEYLSPEAYEAFVEDPSNDNYHYYRGKDYDQKRMGIIERYKKYNGMEGNSPTSEQSPEPYPTSGKTMPDVEDINQDNTLEENENYYQYKVNLDPREMKVGENYITDKRVIKDIEMPNGKKSQVTWYQFKIPVKNPDKRVGAIRDFKSIRFMRMFLRGFEDSVILRFAKLNLVRGEWRNYTKSLYQAGENLSAPEYSDGRMRISAVNIEENSNKTPVNYVLPPGIDRVIDPTNPQLRQLNEQAIVFKVENLEDGDARAAFKNVNMDVRQFKKLRMFLHTEALENEILNSGDLRAFIRLGTDYRNNYYEYEIPLDVTSPGYYNNSSGSDRKQVWKNEMVIKLDKLPELKLERNQAMRKGNSNISVNTIYTSVENKTRITVRGNPNLSDIRTIMMGVRNPDQQDNSLSDDDGMPKSGEIWLNELRLTDFRENGGWAARGRVSTQLADLGRLNIAGNMSTPGFGSIDKKVNQRKKEETAQYDLSTNLDLGKFFPKKAGVKIPMYLGYSERFITPQYNPLNPDIELKDALDVAEDERARDSLKNMTQDYVRRKSINFNNIRVTPQNQGQPAIYDISNFSLNYSYNEFYSRDINTKYNLLEEFKGGLVYNFNTQPKAVTPFQGIGGIFDSDLFRIIRDFNFYYYPSSITFSTNVRRSYNAIQHRNISNPGIRYDPTYDKNFMWNRNYNIKFDLTRSLKLNFTATNRARIDEPQGIVNKRKDPLQYERWKDSVLTNVKNLGRNTDYRHKWDLSYRVPINKLPLLDWVNVSSRYNGTYNWQAGPLLPDTSSINLGNTIRNSNTIQLNSQFNMNSLYNKVGFLKRINQQSRGGQQEKEFETVNYNEENVDFEANEPERIIHNLMTENIQVEAFDNQGKKIEGNYEVINQRAIRYETESDYENATVEIQGKVEKKENPLIFIAENLAKIAMGVKNISISYSESEGSELPGFLQTHKFMGLDFDPSTELEQYGKEAGGQFAPTIPFILGLQNEGFAELARKNHWITPDPNLSTPFTLTHRENLNLRASIEPFQGFRIDLTGSRSKSNNSREYYTADSLGLPVTAKGLQEQGNFSMSFLSIGTAFDPITQENNYESRAFKKLRSNRKKISQRLARERRNKSAKNQNPNTPGYNPSSPEEDGYWKGFGPTSQQVLIPAFLSAYGEYTLGNVPSSKFPQIPFPNWRINFSKLSNIGFIKKVAQNVNISHSYKCTYTIGTYLLNPDYNELEDHLSYVRDMKNNFVPKYEINSVAINEQFNPLLNFDVTWQNNLTTRFQLSRSRRVSLSFANNQITETLSKQYSFSVGYRFENFNLIVDFGGQREALQNDLNIKGNVKIRDNLTILRKLGEDVDDQPTAGQRNVVLGFSADYALSNRFNVRAFFDRNVNEPKISRSYPTSNTNFGFSLRFTLAE
jgi:cell surface protein SprA